MRNIFLSLILSMVVCQISEATQNSLVDDRYKEHKALIKPGANVNHRDKNDSTALTSASYHGDITFVRSLLENGANIQDEVAWSALVIASIKDHIEIVRLLLEYGADVNHTHKAGYSILDYEDFLSEDVIRLLRESVE